MRCFTFHLRRSRLAALFASPALFVVLASCGGQIEDNGIVSLNSNDLQDTQWQVTSSSIDPRTDAAAVLDNDAADGEWQTVTTPGELIAQGVEPGAKQTIWYRLVFTLPEDPLHPADPAALRLGEISDRDVTFVNGVRIGSTGEWDAAKPQAYDAVRLYELPPNLLHGGKNVVHIHVRGYFAEELGIYRGRAELGPARLMFREFYLENVGEILTLMIYVTFGLYFLLFFVRRRQEQENLYFALFLFSLVIYSVLRTQFKYELGLELHFWKRIQTISVIATFPLFYLFLRNYFPAPARIERWYDWLSRIGSYIGYAAHVAPLIAITIILIFDETSTWQAVLNGVAQPGWILYFLAIALLLARELIRGDLDALTMLISVMILVVAIVLDVLTGRAIINLPTLVTYAFTFFVISMALILANRFVRLNNETERLNVRLEKYNAASRRFVPFEFLQFLDHDDIVDVELGDQVQKEMTILFSDIRSFTTLSENMSPRENFDFINSYLRRMGPIIRENHGFIDKYIGDAIMALFDRSAEDAIESAVGMQRSLVKWNAGRVKYGYNAIDIGVGIHRGLLMLGTIGENERMEGTVISDAVNLAARVEGLTKFYRTGLLVTGDVRMSMTRSDTFSMRFLDRVRVKGKMEPVELYEVLDGLPPEERDARMQATPRYEEAFAAYVQGDFSAAERIFGELTAAGDPTAGMFVGRCRDFQINGAPANWDGALSLTSK